MINVTIGKEQMRDRKMKWICLFLIIIALPVHADQSSGTASKFSVGPDSYCVVAATRDQIFIELRSYTADRLLEDVALLSRYMEPEYEIADVVLDQHEEVIVRTRGGGTGIHETHLEVFGFLSDRIVRLGDFIIDRSLVEENREELRSGTVSFREKNVLVYRYRDSVIEGGKTIAKDTVETYRFDPKSMRYEFQR